MQKQRGTFCPFGKAFSCFSALQKKGTVGTTFVSLCETYFSASQKKGLFILFCVAEKMPRFPFENDFQPKAEKMFELCSNNKGFTL